MCEVIKDDNRGVSKEIGGDFISSDAPRSLEVDMFMGRDELQ